MPDRPSDPFDPRFQRPRNPREPDPRYSRGGPDEHLGPADPDPWYDPAIDRSGYDRRGPDPRYEYPDDPRYASRGDSGRRVDGAGPPGSSPTRRPTMRLVVILAVLAVLLLAGWMAYRMTRAGPGEDRLDEGEVGTAGETATADQRCGSQQTYDLVKRELFRRAAQVRGSDSNAFDQLSGYAVVRVTSPVVRRQDEELGTLVCSGTIALDLPPGVSVVGGRRTLTAQADYALQPAADRSGDVVTLSGADSIVVPLATLARVGGQPGLPEQGTAPQPSPPAVPTAPVPPAAPSAPAPAANPREDTAPAPTAQEPAPQVAARPSFNCANARTRGEIAVCRSDRLATLDRRMSAEFFGAVRQANPEQRALLQRTRGTFLAYRDRCTSDVCIAGAYNDRIREIRDIINDRWRPR